MDTTVAFCYRTGNENGELGIRSSRRDVDSPSAYSLPLELWPSGDVFWGWEKQSVGVGWLEGRRSLGSTDERSKLGVRKAVIGDLQIWGCGDCIWGNRKKRIIIILI